MKRGAATVNVDAPAVHKWRSHLEAACKKVTANYAKGVHDLHTVEKAQNVACSLCHLPKYSMDFVVFECAPAKREFSAPYYPKEDLPHRFCQDCVVQLVREGANYCKSNNVKLPGIGERVHLVLCPLCRSPNVLMSETRFYEGLERQNLAKNGVMMHFVVHLGATRLLHENFYVAECYENQRRPALGCFSPENLLTTDWRGKFSTPAGNEIMSLEQTINIPNKSWIWVEAWNPDRTVGGRNGWMYAPRWPATRIESPGTGWMAQCSFFSFVRRRRTLRTRIRFNPLVVSELQQIEEEIRDSGQGE